MNYKKFRGKNRSPSSDEFEENSSEEDHSTANSKLLRQMADKNVEGPSPATSDLRKLISKFYTQLGAVLGQNNAKATT